MGELIAALMIWISAYNGLPVPAEHPTVVLIDQCEIRQLHAGSAAVDCEDDSLHAEAIYMPERKTIYLPDTWSAGNLGDVGTLLHELVHHMQFENGMDRKAISCPGQQIEAPAYDAEISFLLAAGVDPYKTMQLPQIMLFFVTQCRGAM